MKARRDLATLLPGTLSTVLDRDRQTDRQTEQGEVAWAHLWKTLGGAVRSFTNIYSLPNPSQSFPFHFIPTHMSHDIKILICSRKSLQKLPQAEIFHSDLGGVLVIVFN